MLTRSVKVASVQAEPVWFDMDKTVDKTVSLIAEAASNGAELLAFPETWIPGYPFNIWLDTVAGNVSSFPTYVANSPTVDGPQLQRVADAAKANDISVVVGLSERSGGTLYMGQAIIDNTGTLIKSRRKLKPTHIERAVYGEGDGSDLDVYPMDYGVLGALCCWENIQPLSKYALYSQGEDIHVASWPAACVYEGKANALSPEVSIAANMMYAIEGQCFSITSTFVVSKAGQDFFCKTDAQRELLGVGGGFTRIFGPNGALLHEPLAPDEEGIVYADCEPAMQAIMKQFADPVGHYSRPDVTQLLLNKTSTQPTRIVTDTASHPVTAPADDTAPADHAADDLAEA